MLVAATNEIGAQRMRRQSLRDGVRCRPQSLGDDLAAIQPAARVLRSFADIGVGTVTLEIEHLQAASIGGHSGDSMELTTTCSA